MPNEGKEYKVFLYILLGGVLISIISSFYFFYFKKDFNYIVETQCDPETETCFYRDCESNPDECPLNNLSYYNIYSIKASDYDVCVNEDCTTACSSGLIYCNKTECTDSDLKDGICIKPSSINTD
jgi:hypothetical protein